MKFLSKVLLAGLALTGPVAADPIFAPGDPIIGGARIGDNFEVGQAGFTAGVNNWPGAEPPSDIINGSIGGGAEKYLNFIRLDAGFIITPNSGPSVVSSMELWVANDAVERDPASFEVWGTNSTIEGAGPFPFSEFTLISEGPLELPETRDVVNDQDGFSQVVEIGNGQSYTSYLVLFPTTKGLGNSMQLSEIQFESADLASASVTITDIKYDPVTNEVDLTWTSNEALTYTIGFSSDLATWDSDLATGVSGHAGDETTMTFDLGQTGLTDFSKLFFRIEVE